MLLTSNCAAILLFFPKRPMKADLSHCGATEQMRTKWGNQANPRRVPGKSNKQRPQRHCRGILISSEVEQPPTSLHDKSHTELFRHALCVCAFRLACQPTAASSPPPFGLVGVNEQQALSNCLCLTRLTECQRKKPTRRKLVTTKKKNAITENYTFGQSWQESCLMGPNKCLILCNLSTDVAARSPESG